jgi:type VI secretion system protein ImpL
MFDAYYRQYAEYWLAFAQKFSGVSANVSDEDAYEPFYAIKNLRDTPHLKLLERMNRELAPLKDADPPPAWLADAELFEVMYAVAMEGHGEANPAAWHTLLMAGTRMPEVLQTLWQEADNRQHMREIYDGIMAMTLYLGSVREVLHDLGNRSLSLTLARANYSGKDQESVKQRPYQEAKRRLVTALARFSRRDLAAEIPQARIFAGLLDFAGNGIVLEAALAVQRDWESKVLSNPIHRFSSADIEKMYGKEGIVSNFVQTDLQSFLDRRVDGTVAAVWDGNVFPFTDDFLHFVGASEEWATRFHAAPETEHSVRMRSSPPQVNVDAGSRPNGYTVSLACQDKNWRLVNRNYPHDEYFVYNPAICARVTLRVDFPGFSLERQWPDFLRFVQDFLYGEKDFAPEDFPESAALLAKARVKSLRIPLLPDGAARLLRDEAANAPVVPERIVYARE